MKRLFLLLIPGLSLAAPIISPSTATVVFVGGKAQFSSTDTVTWSLVAGSSGSISGTGLYTAPSSIPVKNLIAGCPALPNDHIYNTRIDNLPVDVNSSSRIYTLGGGGTNYVSFEVSFPENVMNNATPIINMLFRYTTANDGPFQLPPFPYMGMENGAATTSHFETDHHVLGVNQDSCVFQEMYNFYSPGDNPDCAECNSTSGIKFNGMSYQLPDSDFGGSTDAAGMYINPLSMRYSELKSGAINHALRFTLSNGSEYSGILWPATNFTSECGSLTSCFPYGSRIRLKSTFDISSFSPTAQVILTALKRYGMFNADGGTSMAIQTNTDITLDTTTYNATKEIQLFNRISQFQFEQVDESSLMISTASGHVNPLNAYVQPANFSRVVATKIADGTTSYVDIGIQPVAVGTKNIPFPADPGTLWVMAGTPQIQIPFIVTGATTTTATCTMTPTVGSLTSGCLYTPPTTLTNTLSTATVTITPTADASQALTLPLLIFPSDGIRINVGGQTAFNVSPIIPYVNGNYGPDVHGNFWWSDPIGLPPWNEVDGGFPQSSWPAGYPDIGLFYTLKAGHQDGSYSAMVPNGTYTLTIGFGIDSGDGVPSQYKMSIDSQGQTLFGPAQMDTVIPGGATYTPGTVSFTVQVSNNQFYFALRQIQQSKFTLINNWSLTPYGSAMFNGAAKLTGGATIFSR